MRTALLVPHLASPAPSEAPLSAQAFAADVGTIVIREISRSAKPLDCPQPEVGV